MRNWSTDMRQLAKYPEQKQKFIIESLINFGLQGEKLNETILKEQLDTLDVDPKKKAYLKMLVS